VQHTDVITAFISPFETLRIVFVLLLKAVCVGVTSCHLCRLAPPKERTEWELQFVVHTPSTHGWYFQILHPDEDYTYMPVFLKV
jgi:hypothetical protein